MVDEITATSVSAESNETMVEGIMVSLSTGFYRPRTELKFIPCILLFIDYWTPFVNVILTQHSEDVIHVFLINLLSVLYLGKKARWESFCFERLLLKLPQI